MTAPAGNGTSTAPTGVVPRASTGTAAVATRSTYPTTSPRSPSTTTSPSAGRSARTARTGAVTAGLATLWIEKTSALRHTPAPAMNAPALVQSIAPTAAAQTTETRLGEAPFAIGRPIATTGSPTATTRPHQAAAIVPVERRPVTRQTSASRIQPPSIGSPGLSLIH